MAWGVNNAGWLSAGEIKFTLDKDKEFPTSCGTGTDSSYRKNGMERIGWTSLFSPEAWHEDDQDSIEFQPT